MVSSERILPTFPAAGRIIHILVQFFKYKGVSKRVKSVDCWRSGPRWHATKGGSGLIQAAPH